MSSLFAAEPTGSITGTITDPSGAAVASARVTAVSLTTGLTLESTANTSGDYLFPLVPIGSYKVVIKADGFKSFEQIGIDVRANIAAVVPVTLQVGNVAESVSVSANSELVDTQSGTLRQTVDAMRISELPIQGRNAASLVLLAPGTADLNNQNAKRGDAVQNATYPGAQVVAANGARGDGVNYLMDGGSAIDHYTNVNNPFPNPDALEEVNTQTNGYSAEYGRAAGAIVNVVTKSGTNQFHGSAFEFMRNGALNARNYFATIGDKLKRNQFGGSIGGPVLKDRLFFFATYQATRQRNYASGFNAFVPTDAERAGDFSGLGKVIVDPVTHVPYAGNKIPTSQFSPVAQKLLAGIPHSTSPDGFVSWDKPQKEDENQGMGRIDYNTEKHRFYGRYFFSRYEVMGIVDPSNLLALTSGPDFENQNVSVSHTYTIKPNLMNNAIFSFNRNRFTALGAAPFSTPSLGINIATPDLPELNFSVAGYFGISTSTPGKFNRQNYHFTDSMHWVHGKHDIAFGGDMLWMHVDLESYYRMTGRFRFRGSAYSGNAISDFMLGMTERFIQGGGEFAGRRGNLGSLFVQDNIRVSRSLSVNVGMRWDPYLPYGDTLGRTDCYRAGLKSQRYPNSPTGYIFEGDQGCPSGGTQASWAQLAPRIGFAYAMGRGNRTTLRGGFGAFYQPPFVESFNNMVDSAPFSPQVFLYGVPVANPYQSTFNPFPAQYAPKPPAKDVAFQTPVVAVSFSPDWKPARVLSWNLTLERQFAQNWLARLGYVGSKSTHLAFNTDLNAPVLTSPTTAARPNSNFEKITQDTSGGNANYNAMQLGLDKRFAQRFTLGANFTWSRSLDWVSSSTDLDGINVINPFNIASTRGPSDYNVPWRFVINYVWQLPSPSKQKLVNGVLGGWQVSGIWNWQAGFPLSIQSGEDNSLTTIGNDLADVVSTPTYTSGDRGARVAKYFSTESFRTNAIGTFGTVGRNTMVGPRQNTFDLGAQKRFRLTESANLQFRGEFFNLFNHVNLGNPGTTVTSASFGRITSAGAPRILQLALKVSF